MLGTSLCEWIPKAVQPNAVLNFVGFFLFPNRCRCLRRIYLKILAVYLKNLP